MRAPPQRNPLVSGPDQTSALPLCALSQEETFAMTRKEFCTCCGKHVTPVQRAKHTEELMRRQHIIAMGGNPSIPPTTTSSTIPPITGNDIFGPNTSFDMPSVVGEGTSNTDFYMDSPPVVSVPHFIEDDDFPPDSTEGAPEPPQTPAPVNEYPSLYDPEDENISQTESESESEDTDQGEPDLERFMDWEYIKQGDLTWLFRANFIRG